MIIEINSKIAENLSKTELGVVNYINDNEDKLSELSIVDIAFETFFYRKKDSLWNLAAKHETSYLPFSSLAPSMVLYCKQP